VSRILFTDVSIFDGTGSTPFRGEVLVEGQRIAAVARAEQPLGCGDAWRIAAGGAALMPGLIESHAHLGFAATVERRCNWRELKKEQHLLATVEAGRVMLDYGFTSAYSGGSADARWEVALREEFAAGYLPGPRLRAASFERNASATGSRANAYQGVAARAPDVEGIRTFVGEMAQIGVDSVKFVITGESAVRPGTSRILQFYEEELAAAGEAAREHGVWLTGHCHSAESIKLALRSGFRVLYHCTWADEEAIDLLEAHKHEIFVAPGPGVNYAALYEAAEYGITYEMAAVEQEQLETLERVSHVMRQLHRRGVRVLPGGDYGFPWNPIGRNARDLGLFVEYFGFTPAQALRAATELGGQIMGRSQELGLIRPGYLADLLLVGADPVRDITVLQHSRHLLAIMQGGRFHKLAPQWATGEPAIEAAPAGKMAMTSQ
jgi:imidazolonepropionase-like amidohydrolase